MDRLGSQCFPVCGAITFTVIHPDVPAQIFRVAKTPLAKLASEVLAIFMNRSDVVTKLSFAVKEQLTDLALIGSSASREPFDRDSSERLR